MLRGVSIIFVLLYSIVFSLFLLSNRRCDDVDTDVWWKYGDGFHVSDRIVLSEKNTHDDTLFYAEKPIALITCCGNCFSYSSSVLKIESLENGEIGTYYQKSL